ncbi:MAG: hypothetical protein EXR75_10720 [Myxococcales bacterium]|nr:hypothetical protein [Myxococcales bacterium]
MSSTNADEPVRVPCSFCGALVLVGARKCRACRTWLGDATSTERPRLRRAFTLMAAAVLVVGSVLVTGVDSPVGSAPPLTPTASPSAVAEAAIAADPSPAAFGPDPRRTVVLPPSPSEKSATIDGAPWRTRTIRVDVHPLDLVFGADGRALYVSGDDASVRAYEVATGRLLHMATVPAQGDRLRLLHGRYLAILRREDASHIPVVDVQNFERDPVLLQVGAEPADALALPDGKTIVTASSKGQLLAKFELPSGRRLADIRVPSALRDLYLLRHGERVFVGALGLVHQYGAAAGARLELFDPSEKPFGATRRSISVGRDPRGGAVREDGASILLADRVASGAWHVRLDSEQRPTPIAVGAGPVAAFFLGARYGVTLDSQASTATVIELGENRRMTTLMLPGVPSHGAATRDGSLVFVALGGTTWPPAGSGLAILGDEPPRVIAQLDTGAGAHRVAVAPDGTRAAVANYSARTLTLIER